MGTRILEQLHAYTTRKTGQSATAQLFCFQGLSFEMAGKFEEYVRNGHPIVHNGEALGLFVLDSEHRFSGRENFIDEAAAVSRRNDASHHFILLQPYGTSSSLSVETTVGVIGIENNAYGDMDELRDAELYKEIVLEAIVSGGDASSYAASLIHASVGELLSNDDDSINEVWRFLDGLLDITANGMSLSNVEAYCGYPSSQGLSIAEAGRLQKTFHKDLLEAITDSVVMGEMMDSLFSEAERDDTGFNESDVTAFKDFIDAEIPRLDATPYQALSASYRQDRQFLPWWNAIGLKDIIKAIRGTEDRTALDISAVDALAGECGIKKQPIVFADKVKFKVKSNLASNDEFEVRKGRSANVPIAEEPLPAGGSLRYTYVLTEEERSSSRKDAGKLKLFLGSKHTRKTYSCDVQVLSYLKAGMYLTLRDTENIQKIKPFKVKSRRASKTYRTEVTLVAAGDVTGHLLVADTARLIVAPVQYDDQNHERQYFNFRAESSSAGELYSFRISAYNELSFQFKGVSNGEEYTYEVAFFVKQTNVSTDTSPTWYDEHLRRNLLKVNRPLNHADFQEVELSAGIDIYQLEQEFLQVAASGLGGYPVILGDDYRTVLRQGERPDFSMPVSYTRTPFATNIDTRPDFSTWKASLDSFGIGYRDARFDLFSRLAVDYPEKRIEEIDLASLSPEYEGLICRYAKSYGEWLAVDYANASIADQIWVYPTRDNNTLDELPLEVIYPPYHPLRLAWLYRTQKMMAASESVRPSPAVSIFDSDTIPDMIHLPVADIGGRNGSIRTIPFFSVRSSSHYWGILRDYSGRGSSARGYGHLWSATFGLFFEQSAQTITKEQVESALDDAREMCLAKPSLSVSFSGTSCDSICRDGIISWNRQFIDEANNDVQRLGPRRLKIYDVGGAHMPSNEAIAAIGDQSNGMIQWFAPEGSAGTVDLSIATLAARERSVRESTLGDSVTVAGGLGCYRTRQLRAGSYLIESRKTKAIVGWRDGADALSVAISSILQGIVAHAGLQIQDDKSHIGFPTDVRSLLSNEKSSYYAVSSADVDHACFVAESGSGDAYLWDYRLPQNNIGSRNADGFYLLARETPVMCRAVSQAIASISGSNRDIPEAVVKNTLHITAQRGIPTVKDLTLGGTKALGEVGILIAVSVLQGDITTTLSGGVFPPLVEDGNRAWLNFVVPFDPFRRQFESLLQGGERKVRPDLACISILCDKDDSRLKPVSAKFSFVEVKARTHRFSDTDRQQALRQYSTCHELLSSVVSGEELSLHTLAVYDFLVSLLTFGFRVFSTFTNADRLNLDQFYTDAVAAIFGEKSFVQIEHEPRLLVVDAGESAVTDKRGDVHCVLSLNGPSVCGNIAASEAIVLPSGLESYWGLLADVPVASSAETVGGSSAAVASAVEPLDGSRNVASGLVEPLPESREEVQTETESANANEPSCPTIPLSMPPSPVQLSADESLQQEMASVRQDLLDALGEVGIRATLVEEPKFSPNSLIFVFDGSPRSMSVAAIQSRITDIKVHYGVDIRRIVPLRRKVSIHVAREHRQRVNWEEVWPQVAEACKRDRKLYIGVAEEDGRSLFLDPVENHAPHTLVAGATKSGKSVLLRNLLFGIASIYEPHESRIILIDPKMGQDYYAFAGLPHLYGGEGGHGWISTQQEAGDMLQTLVAEMNERTRMLSKYHCENLPQYQAVVGKDSPDWMPELWVFHDEFATWMLDRGYKQLVDNTIAQLAVMARSVGIHLVFATQRPSADVVTPQTRSNLGNRLVLKVADVNNSTIALGRPGAENLLGGGHILLKREGEDGDEPVEGQVAFHDKRDIEAQVRVMIDGSAGLMLAEPLVSRRG